MIEDDLVAAVEPWVTPDLETYVREIGKMFAEVEFYADDDPGWSVLLDVDRALAKDLPFLAQFVGERLPLGLPEADAREWIKDSPNLRRGTLESVIRVAQRHLTGQRTVRVRERSHSDGVSDDPDRITVQTYVSETPNPTLTLTDLRRDAVPAEIILNYSAISGQDWANVMATNANWGVVNTTYASWDAVRTTLPAGYTLFTRPRAPA